MRCPALAGKVHFWVRNVVLLEGVAVRPEHGAVIGQGGSREVGYDQVR